MEPPTSCNGLQAYPSQHALGLRGEREERRRGRKGEGGEREEKRKREERGRGGEGEEEGEEQCHLNDMQLLKILHFGGSYRCVPCADRNCVPERGWRTEAAMAVTAPADNRKF